MDGFRQISDCLPAWLTAEIGKEGPEREAPAKFRKTDEVSKPLPMKEDYTDRYMTIASQSGSPHPAVVIYLRVKVSGRSPEGRSNEAPAFRRNARGSRLRETVFVVVGGRDHAAPRPMID